VRTDQGAYGFVEMSLFALSTLPEFQGILADHGLDWTSIDTASAAHQEAADAVLAAFVADYLEIFAADREASLGDSAQFVPLDTTASAFGSLPGVQYGFTLVDDNEVVMERVLSFATFDGDYLYIISAFYLPNHESAFPSDEALLTFEPYLRQIVAGLPVAGQ
jgi:hypothetical protein